MATDLSALLHPDSQRVTAINSVLRSAGDGNLEQAISAYGGGLSEADKSMLRSLSKDELSALSTGVGKLGALMSTAKLDNNVNI